MVFSPLWKYALGAIIGGLVGGALHFLRSRPKKELPPITGTHVLRYGLALRVFSVVGLVLFLLLLAGVIVFPKKEIQSAEWTIAGGFVAAFVIATIEVFGVSHRLSDEGIEGKTPWTGRTEVRWEEIVSIRYDAIMGWYVITASTGAKVRLNGLLSGLRAFSRFVHERVEPSAYDHALTQRMLERGNPFLG